MVDPLFWLGLSILLVAVSLTAVLVAALPALRELARAARSAEKLFDTLSRELPPTLESIRLTGLEITNLTEDVSQGVQDASRVVKQVDQSIIGVKQQAKKAQRTTRSIVVGFKAAWQTLTQPAPAKTVDRLPPGASAPVQFVNEYAETVESTPSWNDDSYGSAAQNEDDVYSDYQEDPSPWEAQGDRFNTPTSGQRNLPAPDNDHRTR